MTSEGIQLSRQTLALPSLAVCEGEADRAGERRPVDPEAPDREGPINRSWIASDDQAGRRARSEAAYVSGYPSSSSL